MPLSNVPMIDYTIEMLASSGIQEVRLLLVSGQPFEHVITSDLRFRQQPLEGDSGLYHVRIGRVPSSLFGFLSDVFSLGSLVDHTGNICKG